MLFAEYLFDFECYLPIAKKLDVPMIVTVTMHGFRLADNTIGLPNNPAVIPRDLDCSSDTFSVEMSFTERLDNVWNYLLLDYLYMFFLKKVDKFKRKSFSEELLHKKQISLIFYNNHHSMLPR